MAVMKDLTDLTIPLQDMKRMARSLNSSVVPLTNLIVNFLKETIELLAWKLRIVLNTQILPGITEAIQSCV